jgi:interleukin 12 receptor beta-2
MAPGSDSTGTPVQELLFLAENIKPYICYKIRVHALSGDQGGCSSIQGGSKHKGELGPFTTFPLLLVIQT